MKDKTSTETHVQYFVVACQDCRHNHRKCDRALPTCNYCKSHNKVCVYVKKKRAEKDETSKKITFKDVTSRYIVVQLPSVKDYELNRTYAVKHHTNICLDNLFSYVPVMTKERMIGLLHYIRDACTTHDPVVESHFVPTNGELALVFAMQSSGFARLGHKEIALNLHNKARNMLHMDFDKVDFFIAATYAFLGFYLMSRGEIPRASFLLRNCKQFLTRYTSKSPHSEYLDLVVSGNLASLTDLQDISRPFKFCSMIPFKTGKYDYLADEFPLHPKYVDERLAMMHEYLESWLHETPASEIEAKKLTLSLFALGVKLQYARREEAEDIVPVLEVANAITELTYSQYYAPCSYTVTNSVVEAARVQMEHLMLGDKQTIGSLQRDMAALRIMAERDEVVNVVHGAFMNELEVVIQNYLAIESTVSTMYICEK
jgi:hypothetical protein